MTVPGAEENQGALGQPNFFFVDQMKTLALFHEKNLVEVGMGVGGKSFAGLKASAAKVKPVPGTNKSGKAENRDFRNGIFSGDATFYTFFNLGSKTVISLEAFISPGIFCS